MREICATFNAVDGKVSYGARASTDEGRKRTVTLSLLGAAALDRVRDPEFVTSRAALIYFKTMSAEARAKYDDVRVEASSGNESFAKSYTVADLLDMEQAASVAQKYMEAMVEGRFSNVQGLVDDLFMPDSMMTGIHSWFANVDSTRGGFSLHQQVGYKTLVAEQDTAKLPSVLVQTDAMTADSALFKFNIYVYRRNMHIVGVHGDL